jgi:hypothetical protein
MLDGGRKQYFALGALLVPWKKALIDSGTMAVVALQHGRKFVGCDLNRFKNRNEAAISQSCKRRRILVEDTEAAQLPHQSPKQFRPDRNDQRYHRPDKQNCNFVDQRRPHRND